MNMMIDVAYFSQPFNAHTNKRQKINSIGLERHNLKRQNHEMKFRIAKYASVLVLAFVFIGSNLIGDAIDDLKKKAEQGDANAQFQLGFRYDLGQGVTQDYKEAVKWYTKAAEQGSSAAQFNLGLMYYDGQGVTQDYKEAVKWYTKAAEQGSSAAQFTLGLMYYDGQGVTQDYKEAVKWFTKAAELGYADAQCNLGLMYYDGNGVIQDYVQAHAWVNVSSANGNNNGQKGRDLIAKNMTPEQIAKAQELAKQYFEKYQPKK
jgi:TPR repeat protein